MYALSIANMIILQQAFSLTTFAFAESLLCAVNSRVIHFLLSRIAKDKPEILPAGLRYFSNYIYCMSPHIARTCRMQETEMEQHYF